MLMSWNRASGESTLLKAALLLRYILHRWHWMQEDAHEAMSLLMLGHTKRPVTNLTVACLPEWANPCSTSNNVLLIGDGMYGCIAIHADAGV